MVVTGLFVNSPALLFLEAHGGTALQPTVDAGRLSEWLWPMKYALR